MPYLKTFTFPGWEEEELCTAIEVTCYDSFYPFQVLGRKELGKVEFGAITIFYGGNGSGKSTLLNIIAEKLRLKRESPFNKSAFFPRYLQCCVEECVRYIPTDSCIITSDEVFDHLLKLRLQNEKIDLTREELFRNHYERRREEFRMQSLDDYEHLKDVNLCKRVSMSQYVRRKLGGNIRTQSNGETALRYFSDKITQNALYLLDEPENSLSAENQLKLARFLEDSARFYNCQLVISTHSPFLLALRGAKVYDLDAEPTTVKKWTELKNVRILRQFFEDHAGEFEG